MTDAGAPPPGGAISDSAIVTGASRGIGLAVTRMLVQEGFVVTAVARRLEPLRAAVADLGERVVPVGGNVAVEDDIRNVVAAHRERFGSLNVLVNNAGLGPRAPIEQLPTRQLDLVIGVNLRAPTLMYRECAPLLLAAAARAGRASVINVASIAGLRGLARMSAYTAAKHGLVGLTAAANAELAERGVHSCVICPAYVDTPGAAGVHDEIPPATMIAAEDVAEAARFVLRVSPRCVVTEIVLQQPGSVV